MSQGVALMRTGPWLAAAGLVIAFAQLARPRIPAMFALMALGLAAAAWVAPAPGAWLPLLRPVFELPGLTLEGLRWTDFVQGTLVLAIPQIPLTLGNAVIAVRAENDELFPDRPVTERQLAITQGLMNLASAPLGGVPMCHGAGGMAGHVRFGARTGGSVVMLGAMLLVLALFYGHAVGGMFAVFPKAILGVILFFAGVELALTLRAAGSDRSDIYVVVIVAGFAMWNMGAAFVAGILLHQSLRRGWIRV
jgi:MFS superfamily sulfate permease-like transporter